MCYYSVEHTARGVSRRGLISKRSEAMKTTRLSLLALAAVLALPVFAQGVVEDAIRLSQGGVGEEVLVAWAEKQGSQNLTAQDIIRLKEAKVPDRAVAAMIRTGA